MIPKDPMILLSYVNTQLRDFYPSLEALAEGLEVNQEELVKKLAGIDYEYDAQRNQFVQKEKWRWDECSNVIF